jgi:1-phosphatidylinositol phosphodiesterase
MKAYPDDTLIVHMNLPGTHDADTWNYSLATQQSLKHVTDLVNITEVDPAAYRCQDLPMIRMLDDGRRYQSHLRLPADKIKASASSTSATPTT